MRPVGHLAYRSEGETHFWHCANGICLILSVSVFLHFTPCLLTLCTFILALVSRVLCVRIQPHLATPFPYLSLLFEL